MIALTVRQPYASRIVQGTKSIENRSRPTQVRGLVMIHAGAAPHERFRGKPLDHLPFGAIIGAVQLVGSHHSSTCGGRCEVHGGEYPDGGVHHWDLADPVAFDDSDIVMARGALGFWRPQSPSVEHLAALAYRAARVR